MTEPAVAPADARTISRDFLLARLGSLLAFLPLGVWTLGHLWNQLAAFKSPEAWEESVTGHVNGATTALTFVIVLVPLLWHTVWGIVRMLRSRPDVQRPTLDAKTRPALRAWQHDVRQSLSLGSVGTGESSAMGRRSL